MNRYTSTLDRLINPLRRFAAGGILQLAISILMITIGLLSIRDLFREGLTARTASGLLIFALYLLIVRLDQIEERMADALDKRDGDNGGQ